MKRGAEEKSNLERPNKRQRVSEATLPDDAWGSVALQLFRENALSAFPLVCQRFNQIVNQSTLTPMLFKEIAEQNAMPEDWRPDLGSMKERTRHFLLCKEIQAIYPDIIIDAFGGPEKIAAMPILDLKTCTDYHDRDYIDYVTPEDCHENALMRGQDEFGRAFITVCVQNPDQELHVQTFFQRYNGNKKDWVSGTNTVCFLPLSSFFNKQAAESIKGLLETGAIKHIDRFRDIETEYTLLKPSIQCRI